MDKYGKLIDEHTLQFERLLSGPIARVWEYLTVGEKRALWFAGGPMDHYVGGNITFEFNHDNLSPLDEKYPEKYKDMEGGVTHNAKVVTYDEPHLLEIDWDGELVSFKLKEIGDQVLLTLTHTKLVQERDLRIGTFAGWHTHLDILVDRLDGKDPKAFWKAHSAMEDEYGKLIS